MPDGADKHECRPCCLTHVRIPWVQKAVGVKGPARAVLWVLAVVYADKDTGECWPGVVTLAEETGLSRWSVSRAVEQLVQIGAIKAEREHRKSRRYTVNFETDAAAFGSSLHPTTPDDVGSRVHALGAESGANRVITMGGESLADLDETERAALRLASGAWEPPPVGCTVLPTELTAQESLDVNGESARREAGGNWAVGPYRFPARSFSPLTRRPANGGPHDD